MELSSAKWDSVCAPSAGAPQKDHPEQGCLGLSSFWWNSVLGDVILLQISATLLICARIIDKFYILYNYKYISWILISELLSSLFDRDSGQIVCKYGLKGVHLSILTHKPLLEKAARSHTPKGLVEKKLEYSKKKSPHPHS